MLTTAEKVLPRATPESQGITSSAVLQLIEAFEKQIPEFHSFMLLRHGKVVAEGWWSPYAPNIRHMLFSLSKSFTSTAVGLAIAEGCFSLDDTVLSLFPDDAPPEINEHLAAMQVRHLLSMSTGQVDDTMPPMFMREDTFWTKSFFEIPVIHPPGTHFMYNTGATYMLSAIVQKTTGLKLVDYLEPRLFRPLGIENAVWEESPQGINMGGFGLNITTEDIAKFGQLYLQKGIWNGVHILPEGWVEDATAAHVSNGTDPQSDWAQGYGYQFWRCKHNGYRGDGAFGQYCIVMPELDVVLALTGGLPDMQEPLNLVWDILLPAIGTDTLAEDQSAHDALTQKTTALALQPFQGAKSSPTAAKVSGHTYRFEDNEMQLQALSFNFNEADCSITIKTPSHKETIACGYGEWREGQLSLFNMLPIFEPEPIVASGAWTAEDTFTLVIRLYRTPFFHKLDCRFAGDQMILETEVNVSFSPLRTKLLMAKQI